MEPRTTRNLRSPVLDTLPGLGMTISLPDGRVGWIAGQSAEYPGKLVFMQRGAGGNRAEDVWPSELRGAKECK
jgi:hypothetical protein